MCFITRKIDFKTAKKDIYCVKCVVETDDGKYMTPYYNMTVEIGKQYDIGNTAVEITSKIVTMPETMKDFVYYEINGGVFHSYVFPKDKEEAKRIAYDFLIYDNIYCIKCVIPKGTKYMYNSSTYISKSIKYLELM